MSGTIMKCLLLFFLLSTVTAGEFSGMKVLCIGCSSGMGLSAAHILLRGGAEVVVSSRTQSKCDDAVKDFDNGYAVAGNAGNAEDMESLVEKSRELFNGPISHLAYIPTGYTALAFTHPNVEELISSFDGEYDINVKGLVRLFKLIQDDLLETKGAVVALSSISGRSAMMGAPAYSAAKAAQDMTVKNMALEVGRHGVRVNSVVPAYIETPLLDLFGPLRSPLLEETKWRHLLGRNGQPDEVGHMICFLLSDKASFITGQNIIIDGGASLMNSFSDILSEFLIPPELRTEGHLLYARGGYHKHHTTRDATSEEQEF